MPALRFCLETFAALLAVTVKGVEDDGVGFGGRADFINLDGFAFELLVVLKKSPQHQQAVMWHFRGFVVGVEFRILRRDGDDFVVRLALVDHGHQSHRTRVDDGERDYGFLTQDENVERVVVFGEGLRDKSVICRIVNGGVENAVEADEAAGFVEFVLDAGAEGDFDDAVEFLREFVSGCDIVPGMDHRFFVLCEPDNSSG